MAPYTEGYAAVEQIGDGDLGTWTDVYGIGAVLWRIVAGGKPPWTPPNPTRVESRLSAIARGKPDPLPKARELGTDRFSDDVLDAIDNCIVLPEKERIQNCDQLLHRLRSASLNAENFNRKRDTNKNEKPRRLPVLEDARTYDSIHRKDRKSHANKFLTRTVVGVLSMLLIFAGWASRESADEQLFGLSLVFHLPGMMMLFAVLFCWRRTMLLPPRAREPHRKPLATCWYILGASMFIRAITSAEFLEEFLAVWAICVVAATGILYRKRLGLTMASVLSFFTSVTIEGFGVACYTWWVSSLTTDIASDAN